MCKFDRDYYEDGIRKGISGYENYHYIPTRSYSEAIEITKRFSFQTAIDYGCAKGFLVHALRQLGKEAWGEDISTYAIENSLPQAKPYLSFPSYRQVDLLICKDVLEHIPANEMTDMLCFLRQKAKQFLFVIPLGENGSLRIREYEIDKTHISKFDEDWWLKMFREQRYSIKAFDYSMGRIKEKWTGIYPFGNGFFILEK